MILFTHIGDFGFDIGAFNFEDFYFVLDIVKARLKAFDLGLDGKQSSKRINFLIWGSPHLSLFRYTLSP